MEEMISCSLKDQEVFRRVWQRVMAGRDDAQCPVEVPPNMQGDLSCECLEALAGGQNGEFPPACERQPHTGEQQMGWQPAPDCPAQTQPAPEPPTEEQPMPEPSAPETEFPAMAEALPEADGPHRDSDLPQLWEEPQEATDRTARLRRQVMEALEGWQFYRHLARRARGTDARVLNTLAGEMHRCARKLSAAYFLLTGLRYWPSELLSAPAITSYWGALRRRHQLEQQQENAFRMAADDWENPDMLELYDKLAEGCRQRSRQLRTLLERDAS